MMRSRFFMIVALTTVLGIAHVTARTTPAKAPTTGKLQLKDLPAAVRQRWRLKRRMQRSKDCRKRGRMGRRSSKSSHSSTGALEI